MNAKLLVVLGKTTKREVALKLPTVLGRSREADVTVAHPLVSRRHCEISESNGLLMLRDIASLNGTMIGGRRVETAALLPNAEFTIGPITFRVLYQYDGSLGAVPDTVFLEEPSGAAPANAGAAGSAWEHEEPVEELEHALPADSHSINESGVVPMPDLMALADADVSFDLPAPVLPRPARATAPIIPNRPTPGAAGKAAPGPKQGLAEPLEVDSSLQSGGHRRGSTRKPGDQRGKGTEKAKQKPKTPDPPANRPAQEPQPSDDHDPDFGSFLDGLE